jgi:hypothetical protein
MVSQRVAEVGILIGPEAISNRCQQALNSIEPGLEKLTGGGVGLWNEIKLGAVCSEQFKVLRCGFRVYDANQS